MSQYIQKPDGKMAGSIGDGRDNVPDVASELRNLATQVDNGLPLTNLRSTLEALIPSDHTHTPVTIDGRTLHLTPAQQEAFNHLGSDIEHARQMANGDVVVVHHYEPSAADNPRTSFSNISRLVGDPTYLPDEDGLLQGGNLLDRIIEMHGDNTRITPIYVTDHSGWTFHAGAPVRPGDTIPSGSQFGDRWDTSLSGFAITSEDAVKEAFGDTSEASWENALAQVDTEVELYGKWVNGDMYAYSVIDSNGDKDSCYGYFEIDEALADGGWVQDKVA